MAIFSICCLCVYIFHYRFLLLTALLDTFWRPFIIDSRARCPIYLSIVALGKNEEPYIAEWIEFHLLVGLQKFSIVNNDSDDNTTAEVEPYIAAGVVSYEQRTGQNLQRIVYNDHLEIAPDKSYWLATIDLDEFIVPVGSHSVAEGLGNLEGSPGVSLNWVMYGCNGQETQRPGLVIERFRNHSSWDTAENRHTKMIVNTRMVRRMDLHEHFYRFNLTSRGPTGNWNVHHFFHRDPVFAPLRMNHYWTNSFQEFSRKRA
jgi:hypothetical protein